MSISYTYPIPDELYVNKFDQNLEYNGSYTGPKKLYLLVQDGEPVTVWSESSIDTEYDKVNAKVVELDTNAFPAVADYLVSGSEPYTFTFRTVNNIDGSTHQEISNPRLRDYYTLYYLEGTKNWDFRLITREIKFGEESKVEKDLDYVKSMKDKYDFGTENNTLMDTYITNAETYLTTMAPLYPWKFEKPVNIPVPKIPVSLIKLFKDAEV